MHISKRKQIGNKVSKRATPNWTNGNNLINLVPPSVRLTDLTSFSFLLWSPASVFISTSLINFNTVIKAGAIITVGPTVHFLTTRSHPGQQCSNTARTPGDPQDHLQSNILLYVFLQFHQNKLPSDTMLRGHSFTATGRRAHDFCDCLNKYKLPFLSLYTRMLRRCNHQSLVIKTTHHCWHSSAEMALAIENQRRYALNPNVSLSFNFFIRTIMNWTIRGNCILHSLPKGHGENHSSLSPYNRGEKCTKERTTEV